jgi:hypothetical protein
MRAAFRTTTFADAVCAIAGIANPRKQAVKISFMIQAAYPTTLPKPCTSNLLKEQTMANKKSSSHTLSAEDRKEIPTGDYAFPNESKEPLEDASHVRNAIARFDQVKGVSEEERKTAFSKIQKAAKKFDIDMKETSPSQLGSRPHTPNKASAKSAKKAAKKSAKK